MLDQAQPMTMKQTVSDRLDATTRAANVIIKREAKTASLRAARLAQEAAKSDFKS